MTERELSYLAAPYSQGMLIPHQLPLCSPWLVQTMLTIVVPPGSWGLHTTDWGGMPLKGYSGGGPRCSMPFRLCWLGGGPWAL